MTTIFFTGFPGFLGSRLLPGILARREGAAAVCLVQPKFADHARRRADDIARAHPHTAGRVRLVEGDITREDLGIERSVRAELAADTVEIFHLAAIYDLSVAPEPAQRVNVDGTRHMLRFAESCRRLERFQYVSTCYVSGRHDGVYREDDLEVDQRFNNHYESTKFFAEKHVQERMGEGLPATVYRPAIVVGDSRTGETQKYDGPYYVIRWVLKQRRWAVVPVVGDAERFEVNVVPSDFVLSAIEHLSGLEAARGAVYQLADPEPLTVARLLDQVARATGRKLVRLPLPRRLAKASLDYVPFLERVLGIPAASVDYFIHPTSYATDNTRRDLSGSGIECPPIASYIDRMVEFVRAHPEIGSEAMV